MSDGAKLHDEIEKVARKAVKDERGELDLRSAIDASYATGNPKTLRPGESVVGSETKRVLYPVGSCFIRPSADVVEKDIGGDTIILGKIGDISGNPYTGAYELLPVAMPSSTAFSTPTQTADQVRVFRFRLPLEIEVVGLVHEVVTAAGSTHGAIGIYTSDGGTKLLDTGAEDFAANGVKPGAVSGTLHPGWYWLAWTIDSATPTLRSVAAPANFGVLNTTVVQKGSAANSSAVGVLPATLGAISSQTFDIPLVKIQGA